MANADLSSLFVESTYNIKVECFPNNEIAIRVVPWVKGMKDSAIDRENKFTALMLDRALEDENKVVREKKKIVKEANQKVGWGVLPRKKEFNKRIQKNILRRVAALQAKYGKEKMRFLTLTLPGSTEAAMRTLAEYSAYINNRINRFFSNIIGSDAQNRVQVWEFQKRRALHSHIVIASRDESGLKIIDERFKQFCYKMFCELSKMTGIDMFGRKDGGSWKNNSDIIKCDSQVIRKDASQYMSKYMGKGDSKGMKNEEVGEYYYPSVWSSWGRGATRAFKERTWQLRQVRLNAIDTEKIVVKSIECTEKYGQEKYKKPLVYQDRVGYAVNIKAYVKPEYLEDYMDEIEELILSCEKVKNPLVSVPQVSMSTVYQHMLDEAYEDLALYNMKEKYLDTDPRRYLKVFRKNNAPIPVGSTKEEWVEYYKNKE